MAIDPADRELLQYIADGSLHEIDPDEVQRAARRILRDHPED